MTSELGIEGFSGLLIGEVKEEGKKRYLLECVQVEQVALTECVDGERGSNGSLRWLECKAKLGGSGS